jgi:hypothetical protein
MGVPALLKLLASFGNQLDAITTFKGNNVAVDMMLLMHQVARTFGHQTTLNGDFMGFVSVVFTQLLPIVSRAKHTLLYFDGNQFPGKHKEYKKREIPVFEGDHT